MWSGKTKYKGELKLENIIVNLTHLFFFTYNFEQKYSHCESVCLHACECVCVCGQGRAGNEIWPWTLCLTGPFSKVKKVISHFFTLSGFSQNRFVIAQSIRRTNLMGCISCNHDPPKHQTLKRHINTHTHFNISQLIS